MMKNTYDLPRDLRAYCKQRVLCRVLPCLGMEVLFVGGLTLFRERLVPQDLPTAAVFLYALAILLPLWLMGIPGKLIDRTYWGEILSVDIRSVMDRGKGPTRECLRIRNEFLLTVRTDDGQTVVRRGISTTGKLEHKLDVYHVGDRVFHLYGTPHVVVFPTAAESTVICPVCATLNTTDRTVCADCGHTLMRGQSPSEKRT